MLVVSAPTSNKATTESTPRLGKASIRRPAARRAAWDSMSTMTGLRPAASARPWRSCTFSLREAAISTSTSPEAFLLGPTTQKSRLTSSSENGMYWLASDSTCTSSSCSVIPPGRLMRLVITADGGSASATLRVRVPLFFTTRRKASATSSNFSMLPSVIQPRSSCSMAQHSSTRAPLLSRPNSTSLTLDELMSTPSNGACWRLNNDPIETTAPPETDRYDATKLNTSHESYQHVPTPGKSFTRLIHLTRCQKPTMPLATEGIS